jgi:ankyrin repeat protein
MPDVVEYLLDLGANVNIRDSSGHSAIYYASKEGYISIVKTTS